MSSKNMRTDKTTMHPAEQYAADVRDGKIIACHWVKRAVERYYSDLDNAIDKGWVFSRQHAIRAISFIEKLCHVKGRWAGERLKLEPWQLFITWNIFGWLMADTMKRRFLTAYTEVARKNGKTTWAAGIALYMEFADKEIGAEVYSVAAARDQARICFDTARRMVQRCALNELASVYTNAITFERNGCTYQPLSSDAGNLDGKNSHCVIVDEYHAHKTDEVVDVMTTSVGAREQPLIFFITTAGKNTAAPCYAYRKRMCDILNGIIEADRDFAIIYTLDDAEDVDNPDNWVKANPCLGASLSMEWLAEQYRTMRTSPLKEANILTKTFNMWVNAPEVWISDKLWADFASSEVPAESLPGKSCIMAIDLANVNDYVAVVKLFREAGRYQYLWRFYIPEDKYKARYEIQRENVNIEEWVRRGYITVTPGNVIDDSYILADIDEDMQTYNVETVAYDPWNSKHVATQIAERGANIVPFTQTIGNFALPTKEFERLVCMGLIDHYNNPVARWMLSNVVIREDVNGNKRPDKGRSSEKIDGIVAAIMALGQALSDDIDTASVYESRGLLGYDEDNNTYDYDRD